MLTGWFTTGCTGLVLTGWVLTGLGSVDLLSPSPLPSYKASRASPTSFLPIAKP